MALASAPCNCPPSGSSASTKDAQSIHLKGAVVAEDLVISWSGNPLLSFASRRDGLSRSERRPSRQWAGKSFGGSQRRANLWSYASATLDISRLCEQRQQNMAR